MPAAVAGCSRLESFFNWLNLLRQAGKSIILTQNANYRPALSVSSDESGRQASHSAFNFKTLSLSIIRQEFGGLSFLEGSFGQLPDPVAQSDNLSLMLVDRSQRFFFLFISGSGSRGKSGN